jgi:phage repressor protein C with HTH and peptisase S24 domain
MDNYTHFTKAYEALRDAGVIHNQTEFAALLGANKSTVSCALNGKEQYLTDRLIARADKVVKEYLSEDGRAAPAPSDSILVIPTGARAGTIADFCDAVHEYDCERIISPVKGADFAMQVAGDSMSPEYPSGSQIIVKRINEEAFVEWGKVYVLDTENGPIVKVVRRTPDPDVIECVSLNPAYQPFTVKTSFIRGWYRVIMVLALK